jgi:hypothetical protein
MTYPAQQLLDNLWLSRNSRGLNGILEQVVALRELDRLGPSAVLAVDVCSNLTEEDQTINALALKQRKARKIGLTHALQDA